MSKVPLYGVEDFGRPGLAQGLQRPCGRAMPAALWQSSRGLRVEGSGFRVQSVGCRV